MTTSANSLLILGGAHAGQKRNDFPGGCPTMADTILDFHRDLAPRDVISLWNEDGIIAEAAAALQFLLGDAAFACADHAKSLSSLGVSNRDDAFEARRPICVWHT